MKRGISITLEEETKLGDYEGAIATLEKASLRLNKND